MPQKTSLYRPSVFTLTRGWVRGALTFLAIATVSQSASAQITKVEDNSSGWTWSQFNSYSDPLASGGTARGSQVNGATGSYTFSGTTAEVYAWKGPDGGSIQVLIDNVSRGTFSLQNSSDIYDQLIFSVSNLSAGSHTLRVVGKSTQWNMIDYIRVGTPTMATPTPTPTPTVSSIDDASSGWSWSQMVSYSDSGALNGTAHGTDVSGGYGEYSFSGTSVDVMAWKGPDGGLMELVIDNVSYGTQSLYNNSGDLYQQKIFGVANLSSGTHVLRVYARGSGWTMIDNLVIGSTSVVTPPPTGAYQISRAAYAKKLRGFWLAESIGNWTGLQTEGQRINAPFFTDQNWGSAVNYVYQNPWGSDDDTDIEYIYLHLMAQNQTPLLSAQQIANGWNSYIRGEEYIWVSNLSAVRSIREGVLPPATGLGAVNSADNGDEPNYLMIDAQLTTEIFGAIAPGSPAYALKIADLPIRNTAAGYAAHAAQVYMLMHSLAPVASPSSSQRDKVIWLANEARKYIPSTSKTAGIFDYVMADFLANCPTAVSVGCDNWESTRDKIANRYQVNANANGFKYYVWYESGVNFATGMMALLYGQGDLKRTIQIGSLSGWDSDNGTATMAGLLGLLNDDDWVIAQFPGVTLSDRYNIYRTRALSLPDYLPNDGAANDTFTMMANRMLPVVDKAVVAAGGSISGSNYLIPAIPTTGQLALSPTERLYRSSANNQVRLNGGTVTASSTGAAGFLPPSVFADGAEHNFSGVEPSEVPDEYWGYGSNVTLTVAYSQSVTLKTLRFIAGAIENGGNYQTITPQIQVNGVWQNLPAGTTQSAALSGKPDQILDWTLPSSVQVQAIRVQGPSVGGFVSAIELDALSEAP